MLILKIWIVSLLLLALVYPMMYVAGLEDTEITISGEAKPQYGKVHSYTIEVKGELYNNGVSYITIYEKGNEKSDTGTPIKLNVGRNSHTIKLFEIDYGYGVVYYPYKIGTTYVIEVTNLINKGIFEFTPQPKPSTEIQVSEDVKSSLQERSVTIMNWLEGKVGWITNLKICAGKQALSNPTIIVESDVEEVQFTLPKGIGKESCARQEFTVKAKDPTTIQASFISELADEQNITKKIPDWVKSIFKFYADDKISEGELIQALQFLIKQGILKV